MKKKSSVLVFTSAQTKASQNLSVASQKFAQSLLAIALMAFLAFALFIQAMHLMMVMSFLQVLLAVHLRMMTTMTKRISYASFST